MLPPRVTFAKPCTPPQTTSVHPFRSYCLLLANTVLRSPRPLPPNIISIEKRPSTYRHNYARQTHIRAQSLADSRSFPDRADEVVLLVAVDDAGEDVMRVCGRADGEEDDEEEGLEVEERCLR